MDLVMGRSGTCSWKDLHEFEAGRLGVGRFMKDLRVSGVLEALSVDVVGVVLG